MRINGLFGNEKNNISFVILSGSGVVIISFAFVVTF